MRGCGRIELCVGSSESSACSVGRFIFDALRINLAEYCRWRNGEFFVIGNSSSCISAGLLC